MENKTGKYFKYAVGEIILVVIGILIALSINNWNEKRKLNDLRQNYYQQLLVDLEMDKNYAESMISKMDSSMAKYNKYTETYKVHNLTLSKVYENIVKNEFRVSTLQFKTGTINTLINTGDIKLIDPKLRNNLTIYNGTKERIVLISFTNNEYVMDFLQNASMEGFSTNLLTNLQTQPDLMKELNIQNRFPEIFIKLEAYLSWKSDTEERDIQGLKGLTKDLDITIELIRRKLNK